MPTLHLTNLASRAQHGPGHLWCAMALPGPRFRGDGRVAKAAPAEADLRAVRAAEISPAAPIRVKTSTRGSSGGLLQLRQWCKLVQIGADRRR